MLLKSLKLTNLLSFGPDTEAFALRPLNVLIGPNGSGKSNFIEAIGLLRAMPKDLTVPIREGGGVAEWIWKGRKDSSSASLEAFVVTASDQLDLRHRFEFVSDGPRLVATRERIEVEVLANAEGSSLVRFDHEQGGPTLRARVGESRIVRPREGQSILTMVKDPGESFEIAYLGDAYESIALYREWSFGRRSAPRLPQPADLPTDHLLENNTNLGLILNKLRQAPASKAAFIEAMQHVFEGIVDFSVRIEGGTVQVHLEEEGGWTTPASRLSDGTLRWLSLLAVLLDPKPPRLVCIEEPELGLHPDLVPTLADMLKEASMRMQLVVTTHSNMLVDALNASPEDIVVCEREGGSTTMRRLDKKDLGEWLGEYGLGQLWSKGVLGGNRW